MLTQAFSLEFCCPLLNVYVTTMSTKWHR